jgi:cob(I)alamin adenosyltransferase
MSTGPVGGASKGVVWSVGDLAVRAGVTVRTLHHYDRIGLVHPSERTPAGHRRYTGPDVARLYRVLALRHLGLGLERIAELLRSDPGEQLLATVRQQLAHVDNQLTELGQLRERLNRLAGALSRDPAAATTDVLPDLMEAIDMTVNLTRIYTRSGDDGQTHLGDGSRVAKVSPRIEALGDIDELNAHIGVALAAAPVPHPYADWLREIQNELFDAGADLCVPGTDDRDRLRLDQAYVERLEERCDTANEPLEPLRSFVLPGGSPAAAQLHLCRTVCRRAERRALAIDQVSPHVTRYLNRLSDLLFILARAVDSRPSPLWEPAASQAARVTAWQTR